MKIQKYVNRLGSRFKISKYYKEWLLRATRVQAAYKSKKIKEDELEKFQLFLLQTGQFNANFTLEELIRLHYPRSPFAMMHMNDYLRCVDSWAMEILRSLYQEEYSTVFSRPIWVDSILAFHEIRRYRKVKTISNYTLDSEKFKEIYDELQQNKKNKDFRIWIFVEKQENKTVIDHEASIKQNILKELARNIYQNITEEFIKNKILLAFFMQFQETANQHDFTSEENTELLTELKGLFPEVYEKNITTYNERTAQINAAIQIDSYSKKTLDIIFRQFKKELLTENILNPSNVEESSKDTENFKAILRRVKDKITIEELKINSYSITARAWINQKITPQIKSFLNKIIFYSSHQYRNMDGLIVYNLENIVISDGQIFNRADWEKTLEHVSETLDNLGYRIDPVRILRVLLKKFPMLFFDSGQTMLLWEKLLNTSMVKNLSSENEIKQITQLGKAIIATITTTINIPIETSEKFIFDAYLLRLTDSNTEDNQKYIHANYIKILLMAYKDFCRRYPLDFIITQFIVEKEIKTALYHFLYTQDIAIRTRYTQTISEIMNFYFSNITLPDRALLPSLVANQITPHLSVESGIITVATSYAMRAFVRVFQLLEDQQLCSKIYVTNQAYYELLINLGNMDLHASIVQTLAEINSDADVLFIEIHPNNIAASYQFKHDIENLLRAMATWNKRKRTLVIDITLNMINDDEILNLLNKLNIFVAQGWLNIILIQSLTKFMQLGLDQRSGGMLVIINNPNKWRLIDKINKINQYESIDVSTMKFFSVFMWKPRLLLKYIEDIKNNCRYVYQKTVENINDFETPEINLCQLLVSSDDGSCYLGLNINGLLAYVDHTLSLDVNTAEDFLLDILKNFLIPICESLNLPLTERTSIGFPLSSINIAFASLRITIGLENQEQLNVYAWIIAYLVFILNSKSCIAQCFNLGDKKRTEYLSMHANQFIAVYSNEPYRFYSRINENRFQISINGANISLSKVVSENSEEKFDFGNQTIYLGEHQFFKLVIIQNNDVSINIARLSNTAHELMIISYLTFPEAYPGDHCYIDHEDRNIVISSNFILKKKYFYLYGPYPSNPSLGFNSICLGLGSNGRDRLLYCFPDIKPCIWLNPTGMKMFFDDMFSLVKKGNILTAIYDMPFSELEFLMQEGAYTSNNEALDHPYIRADNFLPDTFSCDRQYFSTGNMQIHSANLNRFPHKEIMIEHDFICHQAHGITAYRRNLGETKTAIEIDYWMIKNPITKRFLSLMIALYSKEIHQINFISRDHLFNHFLFELSYKNSERVFSMSIQVVIKFQNELIALLEQYCRKSNKLSTQATVFFKPAEHQIQWPSGSKGIDSVKNRTLIIDGLKILGIR